MDKFLALVRGMLRAELGLVWESTREGAEEGEREMVKGLVEGLGRWALSTGRGTGEGRKVPDGVRYHVLDVWVDELEALFREGEEEEGEGGREGCDDKRRSAVLDMVMGLVEGLARDALTKGVRLRAKEVLADERLQEWRK